MMVTTTPMTHSRNTGLRRTAALLLLSILTVAAPLAQGQQKGSGKNSFPRPPDAVPKWVKPPVTAPHTQYHTFPSALAKGPVSYLIYLPPDYEKSGDKRYPVVYWLHGRGGSDNGIPAFAKRITAAIEAGKTPPMLIVFANGLPTGAYIDWANGERPVESVITKELIPHIDKTWRTIASREGRMVEGFSMGGGGAARFGFKYPELFGSVGIFAGTFHQAASLQQDDAELFKWMHGTLERYNANDPFTLAGKNADRLRTGTAIRITYGQRDGRSRRDKNLHELLERLNIPHQYEVIPGVGHNYPQLCDGLGEKHWAFYRTAFASAAPPAGPAGQ